MKDEIGKPCFGLTEHHSTYLCRVLNHILNYMLELSNTWEKSFKKPVRGLFKGCEHMVSPGDENFTHRPGILHLHKSVMVDAFCVVFRDAHRHKAHFVLQTLRAAQMTCKQEINCMRPSSQSHCAAFSKQENYNKCWLTGVCVCVCVCCKHLQRSHVPS